MIPQSGTRKEALHSWRDLQDRVRPRNHVYKKKLGNGGIEGQFPKVLPTVARGFDNGTQGDDMLRGAQTPTQVGHPVFDDQATGRFGDATADRLMLAHPLCVVHPEKVVLKIGDGFVEPFLGRLP